MRHLPAARLAGPADVGGAALHVAAAGATKCYPAGGHPSLVRYRAGGRTITVLGTGAPLANSGLARPGNASLALNLLGARSRLVWLVPGPPAPGSGGASGPALFTSIVPFGAYLVLIQLAIAAVLAALWRGRRLGPVVAERLPVVVRAAETVEGHGRLYRSRRARDRAAAALREAARGRILRLLGLPGSAGARPAAAMLAARGGRPVAEITALLAGPVPADDAALVALADGLDALERDALDREVRNPLTADTPFSVRDADTGADDPRDALAAVRNEIAKAVVGQDQAVTGVIIALLCRGHVLLEGVPGVAKTLLVRALAASLSLQGRRIQFTPDLMPGDVTGSLIYDAKTAEFEFREGPVFTNLLLADEINRTPPKTQAALLEAMEERQVSVEGTPRPLPEPFLVAATQNPIEYEGTYPLPEAQLDRFLLKLTVPVPGRDDEIGMLARHAAGFSPARPGRGGLRPVAGRGELAAAARAVRSVRIAPEVTAYIVDLCRATRQSPSLQLGVSPRGATALLATEPRVGVAGGPGVRHPRRREGAGPADVPAPASSSGRRPSWKAPPPTACSTACWLGPSPSPR